MLKPNLFTFMAYFGVILIWSTTPLAISWGANEVGFLFSLMTRMILGGIIALLALFIFKISFDLNKKAALAYLFSGLGIYFAMSATYAGALYLPSAWLSVIFGFSPVLTGLFASYFLAERLTLHQFVGLFLAIIGLICIFWQGLQWGANYAKGFYLLIFAVSAQALSAVAIKKVNAKQHGLAMTAMGLLVAAPLFIISWWIFDGQLPATISKRALISILYLAFMGSVVGFSLYYYLINVLQASTVSLITLVTPVSSLFIGYWFNHEKITISVVFGTVFIMLGFIIFQSRYLWHKKAL